MRVVLELPKFDTGQYEGCEFHMVAGDATLVIEIAKVGKFSITFRRARWHRFTPVNSCDASWIKDAYFRLVELSGGELIDSLESVEIEVCFPQAEIAAVGRDLPSVGDDSTGPLYLVDGAVGRSLCTPRCVAAPLLTRGRSR